MSVFSPKATTVQQGAVRSNLSPAGPLALGYSANRIRVGRAGSVIPASMLGFPPDIFLNFSTNLAQQGATVSPATGLLTVTRASSGQASDTAGNWFTFGNNVDRQTNQGLLIEEARTNLFLNSQVPVTQSVTVVNASTYAVSVVGIGSLTLSGALTGTVTQGSPVIGAATGTSLTVTTTGLTGAFVNAQVELGGSATSPIVTTGASSTRSADAITLTSPSVFGSGYTLYAAAISQVPSTYSNATFTACASDGSANNRLIIARTASLNQPLGISVSGGVVTNIGSGSAWTQNIVGKIAVSTRSSIQNGSFNGTGFSPFFGTLPVGVNAVNIGANQAGTGGFFMGYIQAMAIWYTLALNSVQIAPITR